MRERHRPPGLSSGNWGTIDSEGKDRLGAMLGRFRVESTVVVDDGATA